MRKILSEASNGNLPESMLVNINTPDGGKSKSLLNTQAASDFNKMVAAAKQDGVNITVSQGYRKLGSQDEGCGGGFTQWCAWKKYKSGTGNLAAKPGTSNHGWGSAIDVENCRSGSKVHKWLVANSKTYGFYPLASESWHWDHRGSASSLKGGAEDVAATDTTTQGTNNTDVNAALDQLKSKVSNYNTSSPQDAEGIASMLSMFGLGTIGDLLRQKGALKDNNPKVQQSINKSSSETISSLPQDIQSAIAKLEKNYGIDITDDNIKKEFDQEGNFREDAGGENSEAKKQIDKLVLDAKSKFPKLSKMGIVSGYRSYDDQVKNFGGKAKSRGVDDTQRANTVPGFSQHHTGKAFDIFSVDTSWWDSNTDVKNWVASNAKNYGFDVTYKKQGPLRIAEPWHLYYVGGGTVNESDIKFVNNLFEEINRVKNLLK
jgi:LAS superfamily LD-carboxypeptidase LdcB